MDQIRHQGIDWIPSDVLSTIVNKAMSLTTKPAGITLQSQDTLVVASTSNPRKPHIVNMFPNGKATCSDCPGFTASSICAHILAASLTLKKTKEFLGWLAKSKRNKGGINFSKAITFGMPEGRGRKGQVGPRKKSKKQGSTITSVVSRIPDSIPQPNVQIQRPAFVSPHETETRFTAGPYPRNLEYINPAQLQQVRQSSPYDSPQPSTCPQSQVSSYQAPALSQLNPMVLQQQVCATPPYVPKQFDFQPNLSGPPLIQTPLPISRHASDHLAATPSQSNPTCRQTSQKLPYPNPSVGEFHIYLLQFCPSSTSMCFGCGNLLKQRDSIPQIPDDLVIVSKMLREWSYNGAAQSKIANVYFHCKMSCVVKKQAGFNGRLCSIPLHIKTHLLEPHKILLRQTLGVQDV